MIFNFHTSIKRTSLYSRYAPFLKGNQNLHFPVDGVHVSNDFYCNEKRCSINLDNLNSDSSGAYRCEVSGDAPEFRIVHETSNMTVIGEIFFIKLWLLFLLSSSHWPQSFSIINDVVCECCQWNSIFLMFLKKSQELKREE